MIIFSTPFRGQQALTPLGSEQTTSLLVVLILPNKEKASGYNRTIPREQERPAFCLLSAESRPEREKIAFRERRGRRMALCRGEIKKILNNIGPNGTINNYELSKYARKTELLRRE